MKNASVFGLLLLGQLSCQAPTADPETPVGARTAFLFDGNPGIASDLREDISGRASGTIGGTTLDLGPDKRVFLISTTGFAVNPFGSVSNRVRESVLLVRAYNDQYVVDLSIRAPLRVGDYKPVKPGIEFDEPGTASSSVSERVTSFNGANVRPVGVRTRQVRILRITPEWIDIEQVLALDAPGASDERITYRIANHLGENANQQEKAASEPFWDYSQAIRRITLNFTQPNGTDSSGFWNPSGVQTSVFQRLATPVSRVVADGQTSDFNWQGSVRVTTASPDPTPRVRLTFGTNNTPEGAYRELELLLKDFRGVGTYADNEIGVRYTNSAGPTGYWQINTARQNLTNTNTQVTVTRITPDLIEGTYTVQNAPISFRRGSVAAPPSVNLSGTFKVIYPR